LLRKLFGDESSPPRQRLSGTGKLLWATSRDESPNSSRLWKSGKRGQALTQYGRGGSCERPPELGWGLLVAGEFEGEIVGLYVPSRFPDVGLFLSFGRFYIDVVAL
jgi:hypothetical protein